MVGRMSTFNRKRCMNIVLLLTLVLVATQLASMWGCGALEALKLAQWQRLGKLEHSRHVFAVICELVNGQAARGTGAGKVKNVMGR